jgi:hypothetical protein
MPTELGPRRSRTVFGERRAAPGAKRSDDAGRASGIAEDPRRLKSHGERWVEVPDAPAFFLVPECYVSRAVLTRRLTSEFEARKNRAAMITAIRKPLDTCAATGCFSPSWAHSLLGQLEPRVNTIEF